MRWCALRIYGSGREPALTVAEHFRLKYRGERLDTEAAYRYFPALEPLASRRVGLLSGGEQQMLAVGRALARQPKLLLIDELSLGLAPIIVERLLPWCANTPRRAAAACCLSSSMWNSPLPWPTGATCWRTARSPPQAQARTCSPTPNSC